MICLIGACFEIIFAPMKNSLLTNDWFWAIVGNFFFLNTIHLIFTFIIGFREPVLKKYIFQNILKTKSTIFILLFFILIVLTEHSKNIDAKYFKFFIGTYSFHHGWAQFNGIYNFTFGPKQNLNLRIFRFASLGLPVTSFFVETFLSFKLHNTGNIYYFAVSALLFIPIIIQYREGHSLKEALYLLRYVTFTLIPLSYIANINQMLIHGVEYFILYSAFFKKDAKAYLFSLIPLSLIGFIAFLCLVNENQTFFDRIPYHPTQALVSTLSLITLVHFYFDRKIFKMSDSYIRENFAPMIKKIKFIN